MTKCHSNENVLLSEMMNYKYVYMFVKLYNENKKTHFWDMGSLFVFECFPD